MEDWFTIFKTLMHLYRITGTVVFIAVVIQLIIAAKSLYGSDGKVTLEPKFGTGGFWFALWILSWYF